MSAGFDAARGDDLGECDVTPAGFAHMTHSLMSLARGKVVLALEGGYNIDSVAQSAVACIQTLLGDAPPWLDPSALNQAAVEAVETTHQVHSCYWGRLRPVAEQVVDLKRRATALPLSGPFGRQIALTGAEVLKLHRSYFVWENYRLVDIPLPSKENTLNADLEPLFSHQVFAS